MYQVKIVSSLEKAFLDSDIRTFEPLTSIRMMKNQRLSFQLFFTLDAKDDPYRTMPALTVEGAFSACTTVRTVELEPVVYPAPAEVLAVDANYLRGEPGLYPDWLRPMHYGGAVSVLRGQLHAVWICLDPRDTVAAGVYPVTVSLKGGDEVLASATLTVEVLDADLPEQTMKVTQWFHCDCLANYYDCEPWSERHWRIVENFARTAVENGINLLLTPLFTPPLDTAVGGERTTVQLLDVTVTNGASSFCFDKLDRWIDMCDRVGVRFFEISHLFTQWGAGHAPKVMATVDGEYRRIFGWETDATGEEYTRFLRAMLPAFLAHMKARGDDTRCLFHISDEPSGEQLEQYSRSKAVVADLLEGYTIMDALSNYDFYERGVVTTPIPSNDPIEPFIRGGVPGLWTYYCCGQCVDVSNRLLAMPSWRNRSIGMQFYKYDIAGFLQWGYNFWFRQYSLGQIDPFRVTDAGNAWPAGDPFSVYPGDDGCPIASLRQEVFYDALQDIRALKCLEQWLTQQEIQEIVEEGCEEPLTFRAYPRNSQWLLRTRERINQRIEREASSR